MSSVDRYGFLGRMVRAAAEMGWTLNLMSVEIEGEPPEVRMTFRPEAAEDWSEDSAGDDD